MALKVVGILPPMREEGKWSNRGFTRIDADPTAFWDCRSAAPAPAAFVNVEVDGLAARGCIVNEIPMVTDLEQNPFERIQSGDPVVVNADLGFLRITRRSSTPSA